MRGRQNTMADFWSKVDKSGDCWLWTGPLATTGYAIFRLGQKRHRVHRLSYQEFHGEIPQGMDIDHVCFNRHCLNPGHLRAATRKQNNENLRGARANNKSTGVRGVCWDKRKKKWHARVKHNGRSIHVGYFDLLTEAEEAATRKRNELFTHNDADRTAA